MDDLTIALFILIGGFGWLANFFEVCVVPPEASVEYTFRIVGVPLIPLGMIMGYL